MFLLFFKNLCKEWFTSALKWGSSKPSGDTRRWGWQPLNIWERFLMWLFGCTDPFKIFWDGLCCHSWVQCQEGDPKLGCFSQEKWEPFAQQVQENSRDNLRRTDSPSFGSFSLKLQVSSSLWILVLTEPDRTSFSFVLTFFFLLPLIQECLIWMSGIKRNCRNAQTPLHDVFGLAEPVSCVQK